MSNIFIHKSAEVSPEAQIGSHTKIWNNAQIREKAVIGENCVISKDVYIDHSVQIGDRCKIQNGVSIYFGVNLGNNVYVGPNTTFTNDKLPRAFNDDWRVSKTILKDGSSIGAGAVVVCGITVGEYAMAGAGSVVTKDIDDYALVLGNPAKFVSWICKCGQRVQKQGEACPDCLSKGS